MWLHQSASCLFHYVTQCPLGNVTQEFVSDIAQVLGRLIDRLHEDEKYPLFIEELLQKVDSLLRELSEDGGTPENILLEKDETIQRLILLNKSVHILKFSIEKITTNLEKAHSSLTSNVTLFELTNITEVENLRYTFYILELFIQLYLKVKDSRQNTQSSQETKVLKRSSITEIWRKKWNPELKETKNVGSLEKSCVLSKCGEILNKIIVDCMDGYGLVSFAALQSFNLLQS
ncbi:hypothetical protein O0L34_g10562 [Tuta absoluta]|nr:hypothetical protein O0L34_g10562 [Tuta absoluta]